MLEHRATYSGGMFFEGHHARCSCGWSSGPQPTMQEAQAAHGAHVAAMVTGDDSAQHEWQIGDHVIYQGKYTFPGEITGYDLSGHIIVQAIGDAQGNYTGMRELFLANELEPWSLDGSTGTPALVILPDENPIIKIRQWLRNNEGSDVQAYAWLNKIMSELEHLAVARETSRLPREEPAPGFAQPTKHREINTGSWEEREAKRVAAEKAKRLLGECPRCSGSGWVGGKFTAQRPCPECSNTGKARGSNER